MIYTGLNRTGEIESVKAHGGGDVAEVYGGINESNPIYYKTRTITGQTPLSYKALSKPLSDYLISGNTLRDGTPTPEAPVDVVGCGAMTGNLAYGRIDGVNILPNGTIDREEEYDIAIGRVEAGIVYTANTFVYTFYANEPTIGSVSYDNSRIVAIRWKPTTFTAPITGYVAFRLDSGEQAMLNLGSTALPWEPYGYKLPLTVNGTEYPIYLGHVPTTRMIKKLVLTGNEDWLQSVPGVNVYRINVPDYLREIDNIPICTHYKGIAPVAGTSELQDLEAAFLLSASGNNYYYIRDDRFNNANDFKSYLAAQYAAGTPVTVWYVLATPETAVVNEPLMKIGDYADIISMAQAGVTIPTVAGANTLTVDTTVQPSEVSITGNIKEVQGT